MRDNWLSENPTDQYEPENSVSIEASTFGKSHPDLLWPSVCLVLLWQLQSFFA